MRGTAHARAPASPEELEERLSRPPPGVRDALAQTTGDLLVVGAGGKMGPSLARMARRAFDELGDRRQVIAVSRFSSASAREALHRVGVPTISADLTRTSDVVALPEAENVVFLVGQKFGTGSAPTRTWMTNVIVAALIAERYGGRRIVALSTGNVYPMVSPESGGCTEEDAPDPVGEYAWSCLARERVFEHAAGPAGTPVAIVRLNYAHDLRYGVLTDLALRVRDGLPVSLDAGWVNVIWQGDANAMVLQCLPHAASPPFRINVTGLETLRVRDVALALGDRLRRAPVFAGSEKRDALLSNASRAARLFGAPEVEASTLLEWTAEWVGRGMPLLDKPTHFEARDGDF